MWIDDCLMLLDGEFSFRHWKYSGAYADQPWTDITIYKTIRNKWAELENDKRDMSIGNMKNTPSKAYRKIPSRR